MDAVKYLKEKWRMIENLGSGSVKGCTSSKCAICPLSENNNKTSKTCLEFERTEPEKIIALVEKWSKEHPQKTMLNDLLEKHPKMSMNIEGVPRNICPHDLAYCKEMYCGYNTKDCKTCWNRPLER